MEKFGAIQKIDNPAKNEESRTDVLNYEDELYKIIQISPSREEIAIYVTIIRKHFSDIRVVKLAESDSTKVQDSKYRVIEEIEM